MKKSKISVGYLDEIGVGNIGPNKRKGSRRFEWLFLSAVFSFSAAVWGQSSDVSSNGKDLHPLVLESSALELQLSRDSQHILNLCAKGNGFDYLPSAHLEAREGSCFYHLGDINLRFRSNERMEWQEFRSAFLESETWTCEKNQSEAGAIVSKIAGQSLPFTICRQWKVENDELILRFEISNQSKESIEFGAVGIPLVFNNILTGSTLEEAHANVSLSDPYLGLDAGYLQVVPLDGRGPVLLVVPDSGSGFEAYRPLLDDKTPRGITFEGFYEWMIHSRAYAENEWRDAKQWNVPSSRVLEPGATVTFGLRFLLAESVCEIENTLISKHRPVAVGVPGYVVPQDLTAKLFIHRASDIQHVSVDPVGALELSGFERLNPTSEWSSCQIVGKKWGRARVQVTYADHRVQTIHYKVIKPMAEVVSDYGRFLTTEQWLDDPGDPFLRSPSVISYDWKNREQVLQDARVWIAGLADEGGAGSWLGAMMKQLLSPDAAEIEKLEQFVDEVLWGRLQYSEGPQKYGVRRSLFFYDSERNSEFHYRDDLDFSTWASWDEEEATKVSRSYNYPHIAAAYWVFYQLARFQEHLIQHHSWQWYLEQAYQTSMAMNTYASKYAQFGQMEGSVFLYLLKALQDEGWQSEAEALETVMKSRAEHWKQLPFPFGSEMPWDSTGQEEVFTWCDYFGFEEKAEVTLDAILAYMPTVPHWAYNGSARRYWDFVFAGHPDTAKVERQLHHYGSGLNAIPVLAAYRSRPDDFYLLRVGYGGLMGAISNINQEGFGAAGFHAYPFTLEADGYSGDYGPNFYGHAINTATYVVKHPEFGWLAFGAEIEETEHMITVSPKDSFRSRLFFAPLGIWITLHSGRIDQIQFYPESKRIFLRLDPSDSATTNAYLRVEGSDEYIPDHFGKMEAGSYVIPLSREFTTVELVK